jgi:glycerophosphoryl diester phosphodiesterase
MTFDDAGAISSDLRDRLAYTFQEVYPKMANDFNPGTATHVNVKIDWGYDGVAYTAGGEIVISANYIRSHSNDTDCFTHELMHVVQSYRYGAPGWLTEGIADYARYKYGLYNTQAGWGLPDYRSGQNYTDAYTVTARFLVWLDKYVRPGIVKELDTRLRNGTYTDNTWNELTGQSVDRLWQTYAADPSLTKPVTNTDAGLVTIYQHSNYGGNAASLKVGNYTLSALQALNFKNDDMSSIKCPFGYKVTLYADDNYKGATKVVTADMSYVGNDWNDKVSSIKVEKARYKLINRHSGLALDVSGSSPDRGANVQQWDDNSTNAQVWEVSFNSDDSTYVVTNVISGKALDVSNWSHDNGANVLVWDNNNTANQRWYITAIDGGYTFLINKESNKALEVSNFSTSWGGNVQQWDYVAERSQQWQFIMVN